MGIQSNECSIEGSVTCFLSGQHAIVNSISIVGISLSVLRILNVALLYKDYDSHTCLEVNYSYLPSMDLESVAVFKCQILATEVLMLMQHFGFS